MGIVALRVEPDDRRGKLAAGGAVGPAVAIAVLQSVERASGRDEDRAVAGDRQVHRLLGALEERAGAFRLAVVVSILEDANPVRRRPLITRRPKVRMALDDQNPAAVVDRDPRGRDDLGLGGDSLENQSRIERPRR